MENTEAVAGTDGPNVFEKPKKKKKKKKKKYSSKYVRRGAKVEDGVLKGLNRLFRAGDSGVAEWIKQRDKAARKRKNGAQREGIRVHGKALSKALGKGAKIPTDVVNALPRRPRVLRASGLGGLVMPPLARPIVMNLRGSGRRRRFGPFGF